MRRKRETRLSLRRISDADPGSSANAGAADGDTIAENKRR